VTGIPPYRSRAKRTGIGQKPKVEVQLNGFKVLPLLHMVLPLMIGEKKEVVKCMIDFIEYRQSLHLPKQRYSDYEFSLLRKVREINSGSWRHSPKYSSISSETVRQRREQVRKTAKIQSDLHGDMQSAAEMTAPLLVSDHQPVLRRLKR